MKWKSKVCVHNAPLDHAIEKKAIVLHSKIKNGEMKLKWQMDV